MAENYPISPAEKEGREILRRGPRPVAPLERFFRYVEIDPVTHCWIWIGYRNPRGYGQFAIGSRYEGNARRVLAHRWLYEQMVGAIADGLEPDHLCRRPACVNPDHLEPVTHQVNLQRGDTGQLSGLLQRAKTHCPQGHPYSGKNLIIRRNGWRRCRMCYNANRVRRRREISDG